MIATWYIVLCAFSAIACAIIAGVFLTFSDFVMRSLNKADGIAGVEVMQIINREVFRTVFMVLLIGMAPLSLALIGYTYFNVSGLASLFIISAGASYIFGVFAVTLAFNVPMNNRLDAYDPASPEASAYWAARYYPRWTAWNHIRTIASAVAATCFLLGSIWLTQL
ncbi:MAG: DUF1772 domain-containing protein [Alphaproteobacteria bacterium]|nr:DUF1772 domain-containing protein [Alphaproteobacteria bacterium]